MEIPSIDASNALQVQQLLVQQQQIQQQYVELINLVKQNPDQPTERLLEIESKINQLRATYTQIQQQLQALEYQSIQGQQNTSLRGQVPLKKIGLSGLLPHLFDVILLKTGPRISRGEFFLATLILSVIPIL